MPQKNLKIYFSKKKFDVLLPYPQFSILSFSNLVIGAGFFAVLTLFLLNTFLKLNLLDYQSYGVNATTVPQLNDSFNFSISSMELGLHFKKNLEILRFFWGRSQTPEFRGPTLPVMRVRYKKENLHLWRNQRPSCRVLKKVRCRSAWQLGLRRPRPIKKRKSFKKAKRRTQRRLWFWRQCVGTIWGGLRTQKRKWHSYWKIGRKPPAKRKPHKLRATFKRVWWLFYTKKLPWHRRKLKSIRYTLIRNPNRGCWWTKKRRRTVRKQKLLSWNPPLLGRSKDLIFKNTYNSAKAGLPNWGLNREKAYCENRLRGVWLRSTLKVKPLRVAVKQKEIASLPEQRQGITRWRRLFYA